MNTDFIGITREIYDHLQDEKSKKIFANRLRYNMTCDEVFMKDIVTTMPHVELLSSWLRNHSSQLLYIYGAGKWGGEILKLFPDYKWCGFVDKKKSGSKDNLPIVQLSQINKESVNIVVSIKKGYEEVIIELEKYGINRDNIFSVGEMRNALINEYFEDFLEHDENEVFIDAGVYDGGTTLDFIKWSAGNYKHIYMYEPSLDYYDRFFSNVKGIHDCEWIKMGLGEETSTLRLFDRPDHDIALDSNLDGIVGKYSYEEGNWIEIPITSLDEALEDQRVTFIKMDIEGSELAAIKGAEHIIKKNHPKLAICVYHKLEDLWTIPDEILHIDSSYKFYLRHYSFDMLDTVLYAI